jgi:hypothetical protein
MGGCAAGQTTKDDGLPGLPHGRAVDFFNDEFDL